MLGADTSVCLDLFDAFMFPNRHWRLKSERSQGLLHVFDAPEGQDSLAAPGLLDGAPVHAVLGLGNGELPSLSDLDFSLFSLSIGVVGVEVFDGAGLVV